MKNPDELTNHLEAMKPPEIRKDLAQVKHLLRHRSILVRRAAAEALGSAGLGAVALRERLSIERNAIVLTEVTESLAGMGDAKSLPRLRELAETHPSPLVRSYALLAIADIAGRDALPYLYARKEKELNRQVGATLVCALYARGGTDVLPQLLESLRSKDFKIRAIIANLLHFYAPRRKRQLVLAALQEALRREDIPGVRGDIERAIKELS